MLELGQNTATAPAVKPGAIPGRSAIANEM